MPRPSRNAKKQYEIEVDPREPCKDLWEWVHAGNHRRHVAPQTDEQVAQSTDARLEHYRREREAWITDMDVLTGIEDTS